MNTNTRGFAGQRLRPGAPRGQWERTAPWVAPLVTAAVLALATVFMVASCGAALI
jgi:hypothetical protein